MDIQGYLTKWFLVVKIRQRCGLVVKILSKKIRSLSLTVVVPVFLLFVSAEAHSVAYIAKYYNFNYGGAGILYDSKADACDIVGPIKASSSPDWSYSGYYLGGVHGVYYTKCHTEIDRGDNDPYVFLSYIGETTACPDGTSHTGPSTDPCQPYINEEKNNAQPLACVGNPINLAVGNKYETQVDYAYRTPGGRLDFYRYYNSNRNTYVDGNLGVGWSHTYDRSIKYDPIAQKAIVKHNDGKTVTYELYPYNSRWRSFSDVHESLEQLFDGSGVHTSWELTRTDNSIERYNVAGQLESITDIKGNVLTLNYLNGILDTVSMASGEYLSFSYDGSNRIQAMSDHTGRAWKYQYDVDNNLEFALYPDATPGDDADNPSRQYHYDNPVFPSALTGLTDERGTRYSNWEYNADGKAVSSYKGAATSILADRIEGISIVYNGDTSRTVTTSRGIVSTYSAEPWLGVNLITGVTGPGCSSCSGGESTYEYDLSNNITAEIKYGVRTEFGNFDTNGNYGYKIEAVGDAEERRTDYIYDSRFRDKVTSITTPSVLAGQSRIINYTYDTFGNRTSAYTTGYATDGSARDLLINYQYNGPLNQLSQIDGPRSDINDITTLSYYADDSFEGDNRARLRQVVSNTSDIEQITLRDNLQYSATGKLLSEIHPNGLTLTYSYYPGNDRLETLTESDGTTSRMTRWTYLATGDVESITTDYNNVNATTITLGYDNARRLTSITDALGHSLTYTLDTEGSIITQESHDYLSVLRQTLTQTFDTYNRLESRIGASNQTTTFGYDLNGNLENRIDANNVSSSFTYDNLQRLTTVSNAPGNLSHYVYNVNDNLTQITDPNGNITAYQYDDLGNLTQLTSPDTGITTYINYDGAGNAGQMTDANNTTTTYQYDALNRLTLATYQDGTTTQYGYDDVATNAVGRLSTITDPSGTTSYQYSTFGEVTQLSQAVGTQVLITDYVYDTSGRLDLITYPSGALVDYDYFSGRISEIKINGVPLLNNVAYYPFGPAESWTWGNATPATRSFDLDGQMSQYTLNGDSQSLVYDPAGNLQTRSNTLGTLTYGYDDLNRLTGVAGLQSQAFAYDNNGNRTQLTDGVDVSSYTVSANSNRITEITGAQAKLYGYDNNGNILSDGTNSFIYNTRNRMANANGVGYLHNGLGQRVAKQVGSGLYYGDASNDGGINQADFDQTVTAILETAIPAGNTDCNQDGQTNVIDLVCLNNLIATATPPQEILSSTYFAYDLQGQLIGEYGNDGSAIQETIYFGNMPVATIKAGTVYYIHTDQLNTPRAISDVSNVTLWAWESTPFGETAANEDVDADGVPFGYRLRFPGQYFDQETGLHYNYFRDYDPATGRYTTSDPIGLNAGLNTYAYVYSRPLQFTDMYGLSVDCTWVATRYEEEITSELVERAEGEFSEVCFPVPNPTIGIPDPTSPKRPSSPADISFIMKCISKWITTKEAVYKQNVELWMSGYMQCTDTCTGEVTNHWSPDRRANNPPNIE